jgi:hypothetical protein
MISQIAMVPLVLCESVCDMAISPYSPLAISPGCVQITVDSTSENSGQRFNERYQPCQFH